ncbi:MAG: hypothetical protein M0P12_10525, partial [Paludibacteraceae bacterium]|nr:hypothetical protein [Paludibacteraceae bacterium]
VFPCRIPVNIESVGIFNLPMPVSNIIHGTCAAILFLSFGINILFLFTLGDESRQEKKKRNRVYRICAYIIFGFFALECISKIPFIHNAIPVWFSTTWVNELFMLEAFAVAWLVKAEAIAKFNDKEEN